MSRVYCGYGKHAALLIAAAFITLPAFAATDTVTNLNDSGTGSLRATILAAASGDTIVFAPGLAGTITLTSGALAINQNLTITGPVASSVFISGNNSSDVFDIGAVVTISNVNIENGKPDGIAVSASGTLTLTNSTVSGNSADGIFHLGGFLTVINSTVSGNSGFGIHAEGSTVTVVNSTIAGNSGYGILVLASAIKNTLLANNPSGNCAGVGPTSLGHNLSDDGTCSFSGPDDLNNTPAGLDPNGLQNNGGPTPTIALLVTSPAVDAIPVAACTDQSGNPVTVDQRYVSRPQGFGCDIGAYELIHPHLQVRYFGNLSIGDSYIDLTNDGSSVISDSSGASTQNICVNVYAFDANEEMVACCTCPVTPNGLKSLSVKNDLVSDTLTPGVPLAVTVELVATTPVLTIQNSKTALTSGCDATVYPGVTTASTQTRPALALEAWGSTLHLNTADGSYGVGETPFSRGVPSNTELTNLTATCGFINSVGSGFGICKSCQVRGLGAAQQ